MNCKFCGQSCKLIDNSYAVLIEICENHSHTVTYWVYADDADSLVEPLVYSFSVRYIDKEWTFHYELNTHLNPGLSIWHGPTQPGVPPPRHHIFYFYPIPDITPENALQKLPTIITFS